ncbi:phasin family protein [Microvirga sp. 2TAF3]|uniref:phasin family protein n=1 Tax=Microvirga sp. 2TAF3 TaxID=3233014 RepID=UPI003F9D5D13
MATMPKKSALSDTLRSINESALSGDSGRALVNATETWFATVTECQREMMGFVSLRLGKDGETVRKMMGCKNLADVTAIHSRWIEETLRDYNAETAKLMAICTKSVNSGGRTGTGG